MKIVKYALTAILYMIALQVAATPEFNQDLLAVQQRWAEVNYTLSDDPQLAAFAALTDTAEALVNDYPERAEAHAWLGIVLSTRAGAVGGLSALDYAEAAKASLERSLALDDQALQGSAYASLGTLYFKVPGWPFGFGDDDKALELLKKSIAIAPESIDNNYFYADYLFEASEYEAALAAVERSLAAQPRVGRELADEYRHQAAQALYEKIQQKLAKRKRRH